MEENKHQLKSIWGAWWQPIRKWFYPAWLIYETSYRFYDYAVQVHQYINHQKIIASYIGEAGTQFVAIFCGLTTFVICTAFLTVPTSFLLYRFFQQETITATRFERKLKRVL